MATPHSRADTSHLLRFYPDTDEGETRAADLANLLTEDGLVAVDFWMGDIEPGGPPGHCVYVEPAQADRAEIVATAFEAEPDSALGYLAARGVEPARAVRAGCGLFWILPAMCVGMGAAALVWPAMGNQTGATALLAIGLLLAAAFRWTGRRSDADDVER